MSHRAVRLIVSSCLVLASVSLCGCNSYTVPGRGANFNAVARQSQEVSTPETPTEETGADIQIVHRKPTAAFPSHMVVVRIQEPGYKSMTAQGIGGGNYSVVTVRDIEREEDFERLGELPFLAEVAPLSQLLLPSSFRSDKDLRQAAARLQADMLLIYTVDTTFLNTDKSTPLSVISLGFGPTIDVRVITTVSALLLDTRTGYIYGTVEETVREGATTSAISSKNACDRLRLKTERQAFEEFIAEFERQWPRIVENYKN